ncbi:hypothetical protein [Streptomyces sp. bgisy034]
MARVVQPGPLAYVVIGRLLTPVGEQGRAIAADIQDLLDRNRTD